jgi:hypothetical protein
MSDDPVVTIDAKLSAFIVSAHEGYINVKGLKSMYAGTWYRGRGTYGSGVFRDSCWKLSDVLGVIVVQTVAFIALDEARKLWAWFLRASLSGIAPGVWGQMDPSVIFLNRVVSSGVQGCSEVPFPLKRALQTPP